MKVLYPVTSGQCEGDNERLYAMEPFLHLERLVHSVVLNLGPLDQQAISYQGTTMNGLHLRCSNQNLFQL